MGNEIMTTEQNRAELPSLAIVVPCYNESEVFSYCLNALTDILKDLINKNKIKANSYVLFIDDGSKDDTWQQIGQACDTSNLVRGLKLSRNKGHQIALLAGLYSVDTDVSISIDADLQDDTNCIYEMLDKYMQGNEIVYGVRNDRTTDTIFKRGTAGLFYTLMTKLGVEQTENHADYRLLSSRALDALKQYKEQNIYLRGMIPLIGFKSDKVYYTRNERIAGESKYPLKKMLALALEGITSLSITPLRLISVIGFLTCLLSALAGAYVLVDKLLGNTVEGWTSLMIAIFFLGGVQMLSLGVIGEYVGKIYIESKNRPKFFVEKRISDEKILK
jgi:glycosyltransferase, family 2